jgi:hypothetical protein
MKLAGLAVAVMLLASCHQDDSAEEARLDNLSGRVTALEQQQFNLQQTVQADEQNAAQAAAPATDVTMWELEGVSSGTHRYATKERCDAALQAYAADQAAVDAANHIVAANRPTLSCVPVGM